MGFPKTRLRRLRQTGQIRDLVRETRLTPEAFVYPLFVCPGEGVRREVKSMPGVFNLSVDEAVKEAREASSLGVGSVILFGLPEKKDDVASGAWDDSGIVQQAARALKRELPDLVVMGDVCLCEYMSHGHCGVVRTGPQSLGAAARVVSVGSIEERGSVVEKVASEIVEGKIPTLRKEREEWGTRGSEMKDTKSHSVDSMPPTLRTEREGWGTHGRDSVHGRAAEFEILNDATLEILTRTSVSLARAGVDIIAPSDMMDGRVAAIRAGLDAAGFENTPILSYAAKFASGFYGPFREAADSAPQFGDRRSYQMDGGNLREAMREIALDIEEGADMIMVKPAMPYLDVIAAARLRFDVPIAAYQVSGEFAMIEAAARNGWIERERVMMESLLSIRRAGAGVILTYYAKDAARVLG